MKVGLFALALLDTRSAIIVSENTELTPNMIVGVKKTKHALEWKRPPSHDRSKQEEKIVDVEGDVYVCPSISN